jgi:hypothetical protein
MNYFIQLKDSPFSGIFPSGSLPIKQVPTPNVWNSRGTLPMTFVTRALCGDAAKPEDVYWLDWNRVDAKQRDFLAFIVVSLRGGKPSEFLTYMDRGGDMPIRVSQTSGAPFPL